MKSITQLLQELDKVNMQLRKVNDPEYIEEKCKEIYGENYKEVNKAIADEIINKVFTSKGESK